MGYLIVGNFLILAEIGGFGFVKVAFQPGLCFKAVDAGAVSRNGDGDLVGHLAEIFVLIEVAHFDNTIKIEVGKLNAHVGFLVGGVVEGNGACLTVELLEVFHQHVGVAHMLHDVCLDAEVVLVEGDEVGVFEQQFGCGLDVAEVTTDEERTGHDAPHAKVGAVFFGGESLTDFEHVHVVVVSVVAIG